MMDSALCLHHGAALHIPSTAAAGLARPYSNFRPSSLSLFSKASTCGRTLSRHTFRCPVICALNKPSPPWPNYNKDDGKKIIRVVGGASVVLACVLGVIHCNYIFSRTAIAYPIERHNSVVLSRPKDVLDSMLKVTRHLAKPNIKLSRMFIRRYIRSIPQLSLPDRPTPEDRERFKIAVADLIKSGMCDEAEKQLINLYKEMLKIGSEPAKDVDMELVLVLIFQGKYKEALARDCLRDNISTFSDGRVHFYKAIIHTMLGQDDDAEKCWNNFVSSFSDTRDMLKALYEVPNPKQPRTER